MSKKPDRLFPEQTESAKPRRKNNVKRAPKLIVELHREQIDSAKQRDSGYCMLAEAVKATFPNASSVSVDLQTIRFSDLKRGCRYTYLTPRKCQVALVQFDQGIAVDPFSFRLRGGQVTIAGRRSASPAKKKRSPEREQGQEKGKTNRATLAVNSDQPASVPDRIGGQPPPLQKTPAGVPFSRRREFGLRALSR